ncbi:DUF5320 domain-containing protein [Nitratidesulfovibrio sp.]|uniref:DUF5320 domain-containing protein n=1 Tax=Nitratidesulfovibrio sp. TaxID=2802297 RepID=UPI0033426C8B
MPGMNGTGPMGHGPGTGRGMGRCGATRAQRGQAGPPMADGDKAEDSALAELAANLGNVLDTARDAIDALRLGNGPGYGPGYGRGFGRGAGQGRGLGRGQGRRAGSGGGRGPANPPATGNDQ